MRGRYGRALASVRCLARGPAAAGRPDLAARAWTEALAIYSGLGLAEPEAVRAKLGPGTPPAA